MSVREVSASRVVAAPADVVWGLVTDVRNHARWIPLTRVDTLRGQPGVPAAGDRFAGVTGPTALRGGRGLADTMVVERLDPPRPAHGREPAHDGVAVYRKEGPVLLGEAEVRVRPLGPRHCELTWVERTYVRALPVPVGAALVAPTMVAMLRLVLHRVAAEATGGSDTPAVAGT